MDNLPKPAIKRKPDELVAHTITREQLLALDVSESAINGLPKPEFKVRPEQEEPEESGVTMNDLPELPFEKILGYLSLQERIHCRAVSRRWCKTIDSFRPKSLCLSKQPSGFIYGKRRWVNGEFARNFVNSARFDSFFRKFGQSILSNLKHLRLCDIRLDAKHATAFIRSFAQTINSFARLEELDIIRFDYLGTHLEFKLNLPMLNSIQIEEVGGSNCLTLDAPKLQNVKIRFSPSLDLDIVHVESVEKLIIELLKNTTLKSLKNLKNLKYLQIRHSYVIDSTLISGLEQLREIHLFEPEIGLELLDQKERYGRVDLKIFYCGCLVSGPNDPEIDSLSVCLSDCFDKKTLVYLAEHLDKLTPHILLCTFLFYSSIEGIPRGSETNLLNRFTDLHKIMVWRPVQDIEHFLNILKSLDHIADLQFECDQAQDLFDRLTDFCAVQKLTIRNKTADFGFLCRLSQLIELDLSYEINVEIIRELFEELKFLSSFNFKYRNKYVNVKVEHHPKRFEVWLKNKWTKITDLDSLIRFFIKKAN